MRVLLPFAGVLLLATALAGCTGGGTGTLTVQGTDPADNIGDFRSLVVQLSSFTLHGTDGKDSDVSAKVGSVDVVALQGGNLTTLAQQQVAAGNYTWIRLGATSASGTLVAGGSATVDIPSNELQINGPFSVSSGSETKITLQLNVVKTGNGRYMLTPHLGSIG
jgi:hypothetical protein